MNSQSRKASSDKKPTPHEEADERRAKKIEWAVGIVSAALIAAIIAYLLYNALATSDAMPELSVRTEEPVAAANGQHVRYTVANEGGRAASAIDLSLTVRQGDEVVEERTVTIDYIAAGSEVHGGFLLGTDVEGAEIEAVVEGYVDP